MLTEYQQPNILTAVSYYLQSLITLWQNADMLGWLGSHLSRQITGNYAQLRLKNGLKFAIKRVMDVWEIKEVVIEHQYEIIRKLRKNDTVIDIGSGTGDFDILASKAGAKVLAYDMDPQRTETLKKNLALNQVRQVTPTVQEVKNLDDIFKDNRLTHCDFLKVDCEGAEYPIFKNTQDRTLRKISFVAMEAHLFSPSHQNDFDLMVKRLERLGFTVSIFNNDVHGYLKFLFAYQAGLVKTK